MNFRFKKLELNKNLKLAQIFLHSSQIVSNPEFISNATLQVFNDSDGVSRVNFTSRLKVDIVRPAIFITISTRKSGSRVYDDVYYKGQVDLCKMQNGTFTNFIMKVVAIAIEKHSNFRFECRQEKKFVYITNLPAFEVKYLTIFSRKVEDRKPEFVILMEVKVKVAGRKPLDSIVSGKICGKIILWAFSFVRFLVFTKINPRKWVPIIACMWKFSEK